MAQTRGTGIAAAKRTLAAALGELEAAVEDLREDAENAAGLEEAEAAARAAMSRAVELEAAGGLRMMFYESVEKTGSRRTSDTRTASYNGGYRIEIRNFLRRPIQNVSVDYIVIYRRDSTEGNGTLATKRGSKDLTALIPNYDESISIDGIPLSSYYKAGSVTAVAGST